MEQIMMTERTIISPTPANKKIVFLTLKISENLKI
jgi:hypothetical protein